MPFFKRGFGDFFRRPESRSPESAGGNQEKKLRAQIERESIEFNNQTVRVASIAENLRNRRWSKENTYETLAAAQKRQEVLKQQLSETRVILLPILREKRAEMLAGKRSVQDLDEEIVSIETIGRARLKEIDRAILQLETIIGQQATATGLDFVPGTSAQIEENKKKLDNLKIRKTKYTEALK